MLDSGWENLDFFFTSSCTCMSVTEGLAGKKNETDNNTHYSDANKWLGILKFSSESLFCSLMIEHLKVGHSYVRLRLEFMYMCVCVIEGLAGKRSQAMSSIKLFLCYNSPKKLIIYYYFS